VLDKVEALRAYAKQQNDIDMELWLAEMKIRARRRSGEISQSLEKSADQYSALPTAGKSKTEVLNDAGINKSVAHRCEKIANIPENKFEI